MCTVRHLRGAPGPCGLRATASSATPPEEHLRRQVTVSATAGQAADGVRSLADRFGIEPGMVVMEMGYDDDVDEDLRDALVDRCGELVDEDTDEVVDVVLLWWRDGDGDLVDTLVDAIAPLADFRGRGAVLLVFYPLAFTGTCQGELCQVRDNLADFVNDDVQLLTVSVDSAYAHKVWADREGYEFPLLADFWPHGAVAQAYGVFDEERGFANRGTFLIDTSGVVRFAEMN